MSRVRGGVLGSAVLAVVSLTGCSLFGGDGDEAAAPSVDVPSALPVTFAEDARWSMELGTDTSPVALDEGIAVLLPGRESSSLYRVAVVSPKNGETRWVSGDFENPTPGVVPQVHATTVDNEPWVIVQMKASDNELQLDSYSPEGTGDRRTPDSTTTVAGSGATVTPSVRVRAEGVVVSGTQNPGLADWEDEVERLNDEYDSAMDEYESDLEDYEEAEEEAEEEDEDFDEDPPDEPDEPSLPDRPAGVAQVFDPAAGELSEYEGPGDLSTAWDEGFVVEDPADGSGFGYVVDDEVSWQSSTTRPAATDRDDSGELLSSGAGLLLAEWSDGDGDPVLSVHEVRSGDVLAVLTDVDPDVLEESRGSLLDQSDDGEWAWWGEYVFGLKDNPSSRVDLQGGSISAVYQDMLYVEGADEPLTASAEAERVAAAERASEEGSEEPSADPSEEASEEAAEGGSGSDETFLGMVDAVTGEPVTNAETDVVPEFVSNASQGVFVLSSDGTTRLYSSPLS